MHNLNFLCIKYFVFIYAINFCAKNIFCAKIYGLRGEKGSIVLYNRLFFLPLHIKPYKKNK